VARISQPKEMRDAVGPETFKVCGLGVAVFILCVAVQTAYHGAWSVGEAVVGIVLVASRWVRRNGVLRSPGHAALTFGASALAPVVRKARNRRCRPLRRTLRDSAGPIGFQSD
jgi:hypothetical protein